MLTRSKHAKGRGLSACAPTAFGRNRKAVSADHLSPTARWLSLCCVSASKPPENGRSMAIGDRADGSHAEPPCAEALDVGELRRRDKHTDYHLSSNIPV